MANSSQLSLFLEIILSWKSVPRLNPRKATRKSSVPVMGWCEDTGPKSSPAWDNSAGHPTSRAPVEFGWGLDHNWIMVLSAQVTRFTFPWECWSQEHSPPNKLPAVKSPSSCQFPELANNPGKKYISIWSPELPRAGVLPLAGVFNIALWLQRGSLTDEGKSKGPEVVS